MNRGRKPPYWPDRIEVNLGGRCVGPERPVYIIAEAGVNHNGRLELACKLAEAAKRAGADAVKFQCFTAEYLVVANAPTAAYQAAQGHSDQRRMLRELELSRQDFGELFRFCRDISIEFLATPFSIPDLNFLLELGVDAIKLASTDLVNTPLVERAIASRKPVIVSSGACTMMEIDAAVELFTGRAARSRLILMHCVSSYPAVLADANLRVIHELAERYSVPVGFSDHTPEWLTGALATSAGACVLEKHFTLDRTMVGPDHAFSLDEPALTQYVSAAREARSALGKPTREVLPCEREIREVSRGSIVSACPIPAGTVVTPAMLTVKRPGCGIAPSKMRDLIGLTACCDIPEDTIVASEMLQPSGASVLASATS